MNKFQISEAKSEFLAILAGGQSNREFFQSASCVLNFFEQLLQEEVQSNQSNSK